MFVKENWKKVLEVNPNYVEDAKRIIAQYVDYQETKVAEYDSLSETEKKAFQRKRERAVLYFQDHKVIVCDGRTALLDDLKQLIMA